MGYLIRARAELFILGCGILCYALLASHLPSWGVYTVLVVLIVAVFAIGPLRRFVVRRYWCVVSRHRTRMCFRTTWTMTNSGALPYLLWSRPTPVGERIRIWLPAGLSVEELERVTDKLAAACWAREARVESDRKCAATAVAHIIRRDPLERDRTATPDVLVHVPTQDRATATVTPLPTRAEATAQMSTAQMAPPIEQVSTTVRQENARTETRKHRNAQQNGNTNNGSTEVPTVVGYDGTDVSDYV